MTTGIQTIDERVRDAGHGLVVGFPTENVSKQGYDLDTHKAYFFRVARSQDFYYEYDQLGSFASGDTLDFDYLGEGGLGSGNDILRVGEDDFHAYHFGFAPESPDLNVYHSVSPSSAADMALSRRGRGEDPVPGDAYSFFNTRRAESHLNPPAETETVAFRNDKDGEFHFFGFEATDDISAANATVYLVGRGYKLLPVTNTDQQDDMIRSALSGPDDSGEIPVVFTEVSGLNDYDLGTEKPDSWSDDFARVLEYATDDSGRTTTSPLDGGR